MHLIHFFEATSQIPYLYHVAFTENVPSIVKKGIMQFQTSNWVQAGSGKRYNEDAGIFAFEHPEDAFKWAFRMRYDFENKPTSIVRFKPSDDWDQDPSDDASLQFGKGRSMRSHRNVPPDEIIDVFHLEDFGTAPDRGMSVDAWMQDASNQMLKEAKQVGILYHYTSVAQAIGILNDNALIGNPSKDVEGNPSTVSFTRNQNYHNTVEFKPTGGSARLAFDGDRMSNQFKLSPVMGSVGRKGWPMGAMGRPNNETEVVAFADSIPVKPYLAAVDVNADEVSWSSFIDNFVVQAKEDYGITVGTIKNNPNTSFVDLSGNVSTTQKNWEKMGVQGKKGMDLSSLVDEAHNVPSDMSIEFTCGACMFFAYVLNRKFGWPIAGTFMESPTDPEKGMPGEISSIGDYEADRVVFGHAWAQPTDEISVDIDGATTTEKMKTQWSGYPYTHVQNIDPEWMGQFLKGRLNSAVRRGIWKRAMQAAKMLKPHLKGEGLLEGGRCNAPS